MLDRIQSFFKLRIDGPDSGGHDEKALQLATAALLFEMLHADYQAAAEEKTVLETAVRDVFSLSDSETHELMALAEQAVKESVSLHPFTARINESFSAPEKVRLVEMLWQVAFADGHLHSYEEGLVRKIAELLYVPHRDFIRARHRVEETLKAQ